MFARSTPISRIQDQKAVTLTPAEAMQILTECRYERQKRDLNHSAARHINSLAHTMSSGGWRPKDQLTFAQLDGRMILINGHHRLAAQARTDVNITWMIVVHYCKDKAEVARIYTTFDVMLKKRTGQNIVDGGNLKEELGLASDTLSALYRTAPFIYSGLELRKNKIDMLGRDVIDFRFDVMRAYGGAARAWENAVKAAPSMIKVRLRTQGALGVALVAFKHCPDIAERFWRGVAENDGLKKGDPRHAYLGSLSGSKATTVDYTSKLAAIAWNAFHQGREIQILRAHQTRDLYVSGTPFMPRKG